jgi:transcriptional regulator with XRE-family HTH domain
MMGPVNPETTNARFADEVPRLLEERGMSIRALAVKVEVNPSHLSRVLRQANYKSVSRELARRVALALNRPEDYFPEYREAYVIDRIHDDPKLRDDLYARLNGAATRS